MTSLSPSETCLRVADIIDFESARFQIGTWQTTTCVTTACIAGHTALLHNDGLNENPSLQVRGYGGSKTILSPTPEWERRQAERLGLAEKAADGLFGRDSRFWIRYNADKENVRYSKVLRQLADELEGRDEGELVELKELERIASEALR